MKKFRLQMLLILVVALCGIISACNKTENNSESDITTTENINKDNPVNLVYYSIGNPDKDLKTVNDALNEVLKEKLNITIEYNKIAWDEYNGYLTSLINSGHAFDIAFSPEYAKTAREHAWIPLDTFFEKEGKEMYDVIDPTFWEGVTIDGSIYGVPTNKELSVLEQWIYPKELVDKYNINISEYKTLESLESVFKTISVREPEYTVMELDKTSRNFFTLYDYEYITDRELPIMVNSLSPEPKFVNIFETDIARKVLDTLRKYYKAGYINQDASTYNSSSLTKDKKVFFRPVGGGPFAETIWSQQRGYPVAAVHVSKPIVTNESTQGGVNCVSATSKRPLESVLFLNAMNTDPEIRNLINYGVEGTHYDLDENGQVIDMKQDLYAGVTYAQGNWLILKTQNGIVPEPLNKWEKYEEFNDDCIRSNILGFNPDFSKFTSEMKKISQIVDKYYPSLMTGSVDVDTFLPTFNNELRAAGVHDIIEDLNKQFKEYKNNK